MESGEINGDTHASDRDICRVKDEPEGKLVPIAILPLSVCEQVLVAVVVLVGSGVDGGEPGAQARGRFCTYF